MSENIISLFPTALGIYNIDVNLNFIYEKIVEYKSAPLFLVENSQSSYGQGNNILHDADLFFLRKKFLRCIKDYTNQVHLRELEIAASWYNQMRIGDRVMLHRHEGSVISGAFYVKVDTNTMPLKFQSPLKPYKMNDLYEDFDTQYATSGMLVKPELGNLLLFPSWLEHETNPEKGERCVISFNTSYKINYS